MLATELPRLKGAYATVPPCPSCGRPMHYLARAVPQPSRPDLSVFKCGECGVWLTEADERSPVPIYS
jgi:predicted RNA-binding Zn-ribbon protein involved in translation (DUF1610 family)